MKRHIILLLFINITVNANAQQSEIKKIKLFDGEIINGRLSVPGTAGDIKKIIIYVHGTGPGTYLDRRKAGDIEFNYFDLFADEFTKRGVAFFSYNRRGVDTLHTPPYDTVDRKKFQKYLPATEAKDIASIIKTLKKDKRLKKSKFILLGWSEGTVIASMVAEDSKNKVDALFLAGYVHENMLDVIKWQYSGESSMIRISDYFDKDSNNLISRAEYESTDSRAASFRKNSLGNTGFETLDVNKDSSISSADFRLLAEKRYLAIMDAYERNDGDWIWKNYFHVTTAWMRAHFNLAPNKTRLPRINIPIYIFQGEEDMNCDVKWVYQLEKIFDEAGKTNMHPFIFKGHNHDLNYQAWIFKKEISAGLNKIFETAGSIF